MLLQDKHLFIVEDNTINRVVFQMALLIHGTRVTFERSGKDAVRCLQALSHVDLIILDLMLHGGISGYDVFQEIRQCPEFAKIPIIAVSAADASTALPKARQMGFAGYVAKPIDDDLFPQQIARILCGEQIWYAG